MTAFLNTGDKNGCQLLIKGEFLEHISQESHNCDSKLIFLHIKYMKFSDNTASVNLEAIFVLLL